MSAIIGWLLLDSGFLILLVTLALSDRQIEITE